ncbi:MAG TPA: PLD nuclease N-terminal domain-containing protein [Candidatus Nanopelagicales bacterium]|nr:PLD nuclease N-terminal domain-containing protein [Candidatus Nanopelagicales bacterium]
MNADLGTFFAILVPILVIQLGLLVFALYDLTRPTRRVKGDSKVVWALIIIFVNLVGPILYFLVGREDA